MSGGVKKRKRKKKTGAPLRVVFTILGLALAAVILLGAVLVIAPLTETGDKTAVDGASDWMRRLDDDTPLSEIVLPGTHNSAAQFTRHAFFTKCQALSVSAQLEAGFRYLDLRLARAESGNSFRLMYGSAECKTGVFGATLSFDEVLAQCCAFLTAHPTETVLLAVNQENGGMRVRDFQMLLDAYIREDPDCWLLTDTIPTLGEARGRLVLLRRFEDEAGLREAAGIPLLWRDQGGYGDPALNAAAEDNGSYTLYVQDRYEYGAEDKWNAFLAGRRGTEDGAVSLNFLSTKGEAAYGHPYEFARDLNARLMELDDSRLGGWILVDFGSAKLAERIYKLNF